MDHAMPYERARARLEHLGAAHRVATETVDLNQASGRVLRQAVLLDRDLPPFDNAAMDGFAVASTALARNREGVFTVSGEARPGRAPPPLGKTDHTIRIATGAPLPAGCDQVVERERAIELDRRRVRLEAQPEPWRHVRRRGEEARAGARLLEAGRWLDAAAIALLAASGHTEVRVSRRPRAVVLSTGDEVIAPAHTPRRYEVRDANAPALSALLTLAGAEATYGGHVADRAPEVACAIDASFAAGADLVVTSAGVSVGARDPLPHAAERLGLAPLVRGVAMKPGHPMSVWHDAERLLVALPGNPVAAQVCFHVLVRVLLAAMTGCRSAHAPGSGWVLAALDRDHRERPGRVHFRRARLGLEPRRGLVVEALLPSGSARLTALAAANALVRLEGEQRAGSLVSALVLGALAERP